jgi:MoaA/NifB/PqqE/SkfB family radical SAM enzyme
VGNAWDGTRPKGHMKVAYFEEVVKKIARETPSRRTTIALYDWGEPTIHPHLPELIGIVHQHGLRSKVSSNLNVEKTLEPIIKANPHEFHVSLSGFHQETYSRTHATGNIEMVKENIRRLRTYIDRFEAATPFELLERTRSSMSQR